LKNANKLLAIGAFCIGTNQIDMKTATKEGIAVFNSPFSNTRSVAELVIGLAITLMRRVIEKNEGESDKTITESNNNLVERDNLDENRLIVSFKQE
jgi:D-3-phosphoglycerate dehydrogenase